jgi:hypothetical protein
VLLFLSRLSKFSCNRVYKSIAWLQVTLVIPWLAEPDQKMIFPKGVTFKRPEQQEAYVREWVKQRTGMECNFGITFYPSRYATEKCSILPVGDPTNYISDADVSPRPPTSMNALCHKPLLLQRRNCSEFI